MNTEPLTTLKGIGEKTCLLYTSYLMVSSGYYSRPQREEYFVDSGYYKYHEAYHLLKFSNERQILEKAYQEYLELKRANLWKVQPQAQGKYGKLV